MQVNIKATPKAKFAADVSRFPLVSQDKTGLNKSFLRQLLAILRITFPSWHSKEIFYLVLHSFFLVARTVLSVGVARLDSRLVRDIVSADGKGFLKGIGLWFALAIPSTYTNTMVVSHCQLAKFYSNMKYTDSSPTIEIIASNAHTLDTIHSRPIPVILPGPQILPCRTGRRAGQSRSVYHIRHCGV